MKKLISSLIALIMIFSCIITTAQGTEIQISAPTETEIMPMRDFYVVGTINRGGKSAKDQPLNIRVRINNSKGDVIRLIESSVGPDGLTSATYFLPDYEYGSSYNDVKNGYMDMFTPPDIIYDGVDRDSIRYAYNKIVVKENYFAAVIYGGATKEFNLQYVDKYQNFLSDITEGEYELVITALDLYGEEVARTTQKIMVGNSKERVIASGYGHLDEYVSENDLVLPNSIVGYWDPALYVNDSTNNFNYIVEKRLIENTNTEFSNAEDVTIFLNYIDTSDLLTSIKLGSVFGEEESADISYLYYDIGDKSVSFGFADTTLKRQGEIVKSKYDYFIQICRVDNYSGSENPNYVDFNTDDGVILKKDDSANFHGVYSPMGLTAAISGTSYNFSEKVTEIKAVITDENDEVIYEVTDNADLIREDSNSISRFEFNISIEATEEMLQAKQLVLTLYAIDGNKEELLESNPIELKIVEDGAFIAGYDDGYWGKMFCDTVNSLGQAPSGTALDANSHITRGNFAAMINRLLGFSVSGKSKFSDLDKDSVFYDDCITAQQIGYMTGDEKGRIRSDELISREEAMIILARISGAEKGDVSVEFKDSDEISFWAKDYVDIMCSTGIIAGFDGYLNPTDSITVAEAAALVIKTIKWMYSPDTEIKHNDITNEDTDTDFSNISISDEGFFGEFSEETAEEFFRVNESAFTSVVSYLQKNCGNGAFINKVGDGLEIRDYRMGNFIKLSDSAVDLITKISEKFVVFSIKYNPLNENAVSFTLGKDENGKEYGLVYTKEDELKNKVLVSIEDNWHYFIQK